MDRREEINASHLIAALGESFSVISLSRRNGFAVGMGFCMEKGGGGSRHWVVVGVLCAKLKLHKITPNTQGIRHYDVMISGEVQSLALPLILREIELNYKYEVSGSYKIASHCREC